MANEKSFKIPADALSGILFSIPWLDVLAYAWKSGRKLWQGLADEGMYEVLDYESTLELLDDKGQLARFEKQERVRYMQNDILAYQDQAWGDGKILLEYRCSPGTVVDQYRPGQKTYLLISLREVKQRDDVDVFHINWNMQNCFLRSQEQWETEVRHRTRQLQINIIFPESRRPKWVWVHEYMRRRTRPLPQEALRQLPDKRWLVQWGMKKPRLHEEYVLKWMW
jgi:hypothetical protein